MIKGIDTIANIDLDAAKKLYASGYRFVGRYIVPEIGLLKQKALTAQESKTIRTAGLAIMPIWETTASRARSGADAGTADGVSAADRALELGIPYGTAIIFAVDYDAPTGDYKAIESYLRAAKWNIGNYKLGVYAPADVIRNMGHICDFTWRTYAWNRGGAVDADAYQTHYQDNTAAKNVKAKVGFAVDLDEAKSIELMWKPATIEQDALKWAQSLKITDDPAIALAIYNYHNACRNADDNKPSGLLT